MHTEGGKVVAIFYTRFNVVIPFLKILSNNQISGTICARFLKTKHERINQGECQKQDCPTRGSSINRDRFCFGTGLINLRLMDTWLFILGQLLRPLQMKTVGDLFRKRLRRLGMNQTSLLILSCLKFIDQLKKKYQRLRELLVHRQGQLFEEWVAWLFKLQG